MLSPKSWGLMVSNGQPHHLKERQAPAKRGCQVFSLQMVQSNYIFWPTGRCYCLQNDACLQDFDCFKVAMGTLRFCPMISMSRVVLSRNGGTMPYADTGLIWTYTKKKFLYIDSRSCIYVRFLKFSSGPWANPSGGGPSWFSVTSASYDMVREWRSLQDLCCLLLSEMFPTRNSCSRQFELAPCSTLPWFGSAAHSNGHKGAMGNPLNPTQPWSPEGEMFCSLASYLIFLHAWPKHA